MLDPPLHQTLVRVAEALAAAEHPWWIVAGAACALHGAATGPVADVDVLIDRRDAERLCEVLNLSLMRGTSEGRFRSAIFATWSAPPLAVELFADFAVRAPDGWRTVLPQTREWHSIAGADLPVPSRLELADMLRLFGRPKDLARAELLSPSGRFPSRSGSA